MAYGSSGYDGGGYNAPAYDTGGYDPVAAGLMQGQQALGAQVAQLQDQVATLAYAPQTGSVQATVSQPPPPPPPPVTLVLRSGQQLRVQNFAVMGQTFWDFSSQPARRIPLTSIDIPASTQATEAAGGDFPALGQ